MSDIMWSNVIHMYEPLFVVVEPSLWTGWGGHAKSRTWDPTAVHDNRVNRTCVVSNQWVCEQAEVDMLTVEHETGRLYTITELTEPTSSSEPVEVNHAAEVHCVQKVLEVHKATPEVRVKDESHQAVQPTSQVQQPAVRLVQCIADLASSVYDGGGRPVQSENRTQLRNIINVVGTIGRGFEVQHTERREIYSTVNSFRTQRGWGVPAVVEVY